ncbi:MAG: serine hydrolase domain-containing protein [Bacteroidota bacterium]
MSVLRRILCPVVIFFAGGLLQLQDAQAQANWDDLSAKIDNSQKKLGTDVVVLIWNKDSLIFKKELGDFNTKTQVPIASCSKWLTAALVMKVAEEGKISLDDPVVNYLPEFGKYFKSYITIRHCLSHMTGIADEDRLLKKLADRRKLESLEEEVNEMASRKIRANPGTDFWYGNVGLNIVGRVLEVVTKKRFDVLIKTKLFNPLGMRRSSFTNLNGGPVNPSGGALSNADDYIRFLQMILNNGKVNGVQFLSPESINEMRAIRTANVPIAYAPKCAEGFQYASGAWVIDGKNGVAEALSSPGLFGTWPVVDFCNGYASLVLVKNILSEDKAEIHKQIRELILKQLPTKCP